MSSAATERDSIEALAQSLAPRAGDLDGFAVLGSGLGGFVEGLELEARVPFGELEAMPQGNVPGHNGFFAVARVGSQRLLVQSGRVHRYEGRSPFEVARSVRAAAALGARWCLLTNAAGGVQPAWAPGTFMAVSDHFNLQGASALFAGEGGWGSPYASTGLAAIQRASAASGVPVEVGAYAGGLGPAYETPAEIRMVRGFGADAVGMSTVVEAEAAHASGMLVAAISCITNPAAGVSEEPLSHAEVLAAGAAAAPRFAQLLGAVVQELGSL